MKRPQATKAKRPEVLLHISRQRALGENLIPGSDKPGKWDLIATIAMVALIGFGSIRGWW